MEKIINVKAKDIKINDEILISICNYHGWERVTNVQNTPRGGVEITTCDSATYDANYEFQVRIS